MHNAKFPQNPTIPGQGLNNSQFPHYRPVSQVGQQNLINKSFNTPQMKGQMGHNTQG